MSDLRLIAYQVGAPVLNLVPAPVRRAWMDETDQKFANRCLPMLLANQSGWLAVSRHRFRARWNGGVSKKDTVIEQLDDDGCDSPCPAISHFGSGVVTWSLPWLFRTPPGWNLLARGPANSPRDGIAPLEGLVEADWSYATFTMNWIFTAPGTDIYFDIGDPVCMLVPQRRGDLEQFNPEIKDIKEDPELEDRFESWKIARNSFNQNLARFDPDTVDRGWQRDYFRGYDGPGDHQVKRRLRPFTGQ